MRFLPNTIDKVSVRRRAIDRKLRGVEILPEMEAGAILSLQNANGFDPEDFGFYGTT